MKNSLFLLTLTVTTIACSPKKEYNSFDGQTIDSLTTVSFNMPKIDFGKIAPGDTSVNSFVFKNTGSVPLVVTKIDLSCGCLIPDFPKKPVAPGNEDSIVVRYTSKSDYGRQIKTIGVHTNTSEGVQKLKLEGEIGFD